MSATFTHYAPTQPLADALERYLLYKDLAHESRLWYRRVVGTFTLWNGGSAKVSDLTGDKISAFLSQRQKEGRSQYTLKSYRGALVALMHDMRGFLPEDRVRSVRVTPLDPAAWSVAEVERLIEACTAVHENRAWKWTLLVAAGYYTGLDRCDLERLMQSDIDDDGRIVFRRRKTKALVVVRMPVALVQIIRTHCPRGTPCLKLGVSKEWFRKEFAVIVQRARLHGTFKKLRKSSGSLVEAEHPGTGHRHLGHTRQIFERHYECKKLTRTEPTSPPQITLAKLLTNQTAGGGRVVTG